MIKHLFVPALLLFFSSALTCGWPEVASAQETAGSPSKRDSSLPLPEVDALASIPDSRQVLRYDWGEDISSHHQIVTYLKALAEAAPDRTRLVPYGETYEGRSLNYLVISSPDNIANLESIRANNQRLASGRLGDAEAAEVIESAPAIVWLAYAVHGNEISPCDAALLTAYHLLADQRPETVGLLEQLVVIIDPLQNADGRDRFVNVFRETRGRFIQSYPYANEHTERWPGGRSNHYWFDMNRDWFLQSQKEVQHKVAAYLHWHPQIYVDAHEMGRDSTFYFPPPTDPQSPFLMPEQSDWFKRLGKHQAGWFDHYGFGYMTREVFDAFYPGYGSAWPTLQGGLGVLWEQASARGLVIDRSDETELTYRDGVKHHYVSGLATSEFAALHRQELLQGFHKARRLGLQLGQEGTVQDFFLPISRRPQRTERFAAMLARNGIDVRVLQQPVNIACTDIKDDSEQLRTIPAGSFHIPVAQPASRLVRALLDRRVDMDDKFLRRQLERNDLRLPDEIYDVTAWSMPLAFDVACLASSQEVAVESSAWTPGEVQDAHTVEPAKVAYLIPGTDGAIHAMSQLIQQGVRVHVSDETFKIGGRHYDRGTLIVKVSENGEELHGQIATVASQFGIEAIPTDTAFVEEGAHMGGRHVRWVRPPRVLLVVDNPTNYSSGHTWHLFDQVLHYPTTRVQGQNLGNVDLNDFNTLVLPDGNYSSGSGFDEERAQALRQWVRDGGTLITLRGATRWAAGEDVGLVKNETVKRKVEVPEAGQDSEEPEEVTPDSVPGAFLRADVFQRHWVTFGYDSNLDVFYTGNLILTPTKETEGRSLVTFNSQDRLLTSGFVWPTSLQLLANTPFVVYRSIGQGHVVAFTDDPNFRAMYPAQQRLFINAAMFGAGH